MAYRMKSKTLVDIPFDAPPLLPHHTRMNKAAFFWFDMEFTDLDPDKARILQVAIWATDVHCNPVQPDDQGLNLCVQLASDATVSDWVEANLPTLLERCRSERAVSPSQIEPLLLDYVDRMAGPPAEDIKERPVLAGNSVHNDWRLAARHYPKLIERMHYRLMDVSSLKQEWEGWLGQQEFDKENAERVSAYLPFSPTALEGQPHDAYYDVLASIAELNFYRTHLRLLATD